MFDLKNEFHNLPSNSLRAEVQVGQRGKYAGVRNKSNYFHILRFVGSVESSNGKSLESRLERIAPILPAIRLWAALRRRQHEDSVSDGIDGKLALLSLPLCTFDFYHSSFFSSPGNIRTKCEKPGKVCFVCLSLSLILICLISSSSVFSAPLSFLRPILPYRSGKTSGERQ